jgi:hypothetical protein
MNQYICFFSRSDADVAEFLVIDADGDAQARLQADNMLRGQGSYTSVEIFNDDRALGRIERAA